MNSKIPGIVTFLMNVQFTTNVVIALSLQCKYYD